MRYILPLFIMLSPLSSLAAVSPAETVEASLIEVSPVYTAPFTDSKKLATLSPRPCKVLTGITEDPSWVLVQFEDESHQGWVRANALRVQAKLMQTDVPVIDPSVEGAFVNPNPTSQP